MTFLLSVDTGGDVTSDPLPRPPGGATVRQRGTKPAELLHRDSPTVATRADVGNPGDDCCHLADDVQLPPLCSMAVKNRTPYSSGRAA